MAAEPKQEIWDPEFLNCSPMFETLKPIGDHLQTNTWPNHQELMRLFELTAPITSQSGALIRFVPQEKRGNAFTEKYEPKIYLTGQVPTRLQNWHDLFNALVWLTFPKTKSTINKRHYVALQQQLSDQQQNRGPLQDALTLFDESGAIVVCSDIQRHLIKQKKWHELFWQNRDNVITGMKCYLFGHALYEKALRPYQGMTAKCLILVVEDNFFPQALTQQLKIIDALLAQYFSDKGYEEIKSGLLPLPLLGIPGWASENKFEDYYKNKNYFR